MGETFADIILRANGKEFKKKILVDTGATFSWIDGKILKKLGVKPVDIEEFETIERRIIKREIGFLEIECQGRRGPTGVVFARKGDSEVLGLHALETLRLAVDPYRQRLKKSKTIKALVLKNRDAEMNSA